MKKKLNKLFDGYEWGPEHVTKCFEEIKKIADEELGLDIYTNQFEIVSSEQMLDAYSSTGMPIMYNHWSFGKQFAREHKNYIKGHMGLALELVINSNPCVNYLLEDISATECAAVIAHAAIGHNAFFKNNYLFQQWTDASSIVDYLTFAKKYISDCEEKYGLERVEEILDIAHSLQRQGVSRYKKPSKLSKNKEIEKQKERDTYNQTQVSEFWNRVVPKNKIGDKEVMSYVLDETEENLLYFLEKNSPILKPWEREILRIVRKISTYYYPQIQTKVMNEGTATYCHFYLMTRLNEKGLLSEGQYLEFLKMHSGVVYQPDYDSKHYSGFNPYRLGFEIFRDIERICNDPDDEDREWFPEFAGCRDFKNMFIDIIKNYRDESFIRQFLSPKVMRDYKLFRLTTDEVSDYYEVSSIHDASGFKDIRKSIADQHLITNIIPEIKVIEVYLDDDRSLYLRHDSVKGKTLKKESAHSVVKNFQKLWGFDVTLFLCDDNGGDSFDSIRIGKND